MSNQLYQKFFTEFTIKLKDPLADILGASKNGLFEYSYLDVVKIAGHSCPTVAGAFLIVSQGLKNIYQNELPIRGDIKVYMNNKKDEGVTGVIANVISAITGACDEGGFKGLGGLSPRNNLLSFDNKFDGIVQLESIQLNKIIELNYNHNSISTNPKMQELMKKIFQNNATENEIIEFGQLWQERVKNILLNPDKVLSIKTIK